MAIGYQITQGSINTRAASLAVRLRNLSDDTQQFATVISGLTLTTVGFSGPDATAMNAAVGKMQTLYDMYYGIIAPGSADNYDADLAVLRGTGAAG